jgi:hypothetical protein
MPQIVHQAIAHFEDSWQPTGQTKFDPWPHAQMKKLVHTLVLSIDGPGTTADVVAKAHECINKAVAAGLIAALGAAFISGGMGSANAAWATASATLTGCLGTEYTARIDNVSDWQYWWT